MFEIDKRTGILQSQKVKININVSDDSSVYAVPSGIILKILSLDSTLKHSQVLTTRVMPRMHRTSNYRCSRGQVKC
jgi:hypothetical protein